MTAAVILVEASPRNAVDATPVAVRMAGGGAAVPYHYGNQHWRAGIAALPRAVASLDFDGEQLGGGGVAQAIELTWSPSTRAALAEMSAFYWTDAPIAVRVGPEGDAMPPIVTSGLVLETSVDRGALRIALADQAADLKRPLLVDRFAGTGGIEGPVEFKDMIKSRAWGPCFNVPGRQIEAATNIWCFGDPRRAWRAFDQVRDKGVAASAATLTLLAWQGSPEATFAALRNTATIDGGGVLCPSIACIKWWTTPAGDLHADIRGETDGGYVETAPEIVARIVAARSTIPFAPGAIAAAAAARPAPFGWRVDTDSATAAGEISELLGGVSTSWLLIDNAMVFRHWDWTAPMRVARSESVTRKSTVKPVGSRKLGYRRNWSPMARGDLAASVLASEVLYEDGTPIEDWKPAQPGADVTGDNTSKDTNAVNGRSAADLVATTDVNVISIIEQALRQDDFLQVVQAWAFAEGQPVSTGFLAFRNAQTDANAGFASASDFNSVFAKSPNGTGYTMNLQTVKAGNATFADLFSGYSASIEGLSETTGGLTTQLGTLSQNLSQTSALAGSVNSKVTALQQAFANDAGGAAKFLLAAQVDANGKTYVSGISGSAGTTVNELNFISENFNFVRAGGGNPLKPLTYNGGLNRWEFSADVYARNVVADSITTENLQSSAVQKTSYVVMQQDVSIARGATQTVTSVTFTKDRAASTLKMVFFGMFWSPDDLQFAGSFVLDGSTSYAAGSVNIVLDQQNSLGRLTITPFFYLEGLAAGEHTISFNVYNSESDNVALTVKANSALEIVELKKAAI